MRISIIAAIGENRELGGKNQLLWNIPGELKRFKEITTGHPIIMGRKTFESIGRVLPNRTNIIITRDPNYKVEAAVIVYSLEEAIKESSKYHVVSMRDKKNVHATNYLLPATDEHEAFIIGGGQIFTETLPITERLYLTLVHKSFPEADVFFPDYKDFKKIVSKEDMVGPEFSYTFLALEK